MSVITVQKQFNEIQAMLARSLAWQARKLTEGYSIAESEAFH